MWRKQKLHRNGVCECVALYKKSYVLKAYITVVFALGETSKDCKLDGFTPCMQTLRLSVIVGMFMVVFNIPFGLSSHSQKLLFTSLFYCFLIELSSTFAHGLPSLERLNYSNFPHPFCDLKFNLYNCTNAQKG